MSLDLKLAQQNVLLLRSEVCIMEKQKGTLWFLPLIQDQKHYDDPFEARYSRRVVSQPHSRASSFGVDGIFPTMNAPHND